MVTENRNKRNKHMAVFYWVGGAATGAGNPLMGNSLGSGILFQNPLGNFAGKTGAENMDWVLAFHWNNPLNWYTNLTSTSFVEPATRSPSFGDEARFGVLGGNLGIPGLPRAKAPCLWGGATQAGSTITWAGGAVSYTGTYGSPVNSSYAGMTYNTALSQFYVSSLGRITFTPGGPTAGYYPFLYLGSNIENLAQSLGDTSYWYTHPLYNAQENGFTLDSAIWYGASWENLVNAVLATGGTEQLKQLRIKTDSVSSSDLGYVGNVLGTDIIQGVIDITSMKNMKTLSGSSAGATGDYVNTTAVCSGYASWNLRGYWTSINRICPDIDPLQTYGTYYSPRSHLGLYGATVGSVSISRYVGSVGTDTRSNIAQMTVTPTSDYFFLDLQNRSVKAEVLGDIGSTFSAGTGAGVSPNLTVSTPYVSGNTTGARPDFNLRGIVLGTQGATAAFSSEWVKIGDAPINNTQAKRIEVFFGGTAAINTLDLSRANIKAWNLAPIDPLASVKIGEMKMYSGSLLDFASMSYFDSWEFGRQVGTEIQGGIVFFDQQTTGSSTFGTNFSRIKGSKGLRLWNDAFVNNGGNFVAGGSKRDGIKTPTASLTIE